MIAWVMKMLVSMTDITKYNGERCILDQIELHIEDKDKIGILGVNGTGKSTLLKIISGIEDYQGKMTYQKDLRINYLPQTPLYNEMDTIMETVYKQIDSKDIHDFEIKAQLGKFGIYDENQKIKELSGGQLKRVALAIALMKPCDLLILDEPTSALDAVAESKVYQEYYELTKQKTSIFISHRLSSTKFCDRIILLSNGRIVEEGTHEQLLARKGKYANMYTIQASYYQEGDRGA